MSDGDGWLPEDYTLKLNAFEVGLLLGCVMSKASETRSVMPRTWRRLVDKLDALAQELYEGIRPPTKGEP